MKIYTYNEHGIYSESIILKAKAKREGLIPRNSTKIKPMSTKVGECAKFVSGEWVIVPDENHVHAKLSELNSFDVCPYVLDDNGFIMEKDASTLSEEQNKSLKSKTFWEKVYKGQRVSTLCNDIINLIIEHNMANNKTFDEIQSFRIKFPEIELLLNSNLPFHAKKIIDSIPLDNSYVTQELRDFIQYAYDRYNKIVK